MKYFNHYFTWLSGDEYVVLMGVAGGRVPFNPEAKYLYSLRIFLLLWKLEILWTTGHASKIRQAISLYADDSAWEENEQEGYSSFQRSCASFHRGDTGE